MKFFVIIFILLCCHISIATAQEILPKREFRGAWIATVDNLDWPSSTGNSISKQKADLINTFDALQHSGINVAVFQIRPACDAFYQSNYEPWSYWLTGTQGKSPGYDPLEFAIEEAHKRGMELHAWFNPYRAEVSIGSYTLHEDHVVKKHPDWILTFNKVNKKLLDPGLPQVRDYVVDVIMDVVNRYDVDGVHFDDYFYVYPNSEKGFPGITNEDDATFATYNRGFTNRADWRRDNVNILVAQVYDSIKSVKKWVKFGISPFGIWKSGTPSGIWGLSAYDDIYCDALAWLNAGTVDYITPQLYWAIGQAGQNYEILAPWWADQRNGRHFYPGQIFKSGYSLSELQNQVAINRETEGVSGNVLFRSTHIVSNTFGFPEYLATDFHRDLSLLPVMEWLDDIIPNPVKNLRYEKLPGKNIAGLNWDLPEIASDGDSISRSVIYRFNNDQITDDDLHDPENILQIGHYANTVPQEPDEDGPYYFVVTALDRTWNESTKSDIVMISPPATPLISSPANGETYLRDETTLCWISVDPFSSSHLQVSTDSTFSGDLHFEDDVIQDTLKQIADLLSLQKYYWRIKVKNAAGRSEFSEIFNFTTGPFPDQPLLAYPSHRKRNIPLETDLGWSKDTVAAYYKIQLAEENDFSPSSVIIDSSGITDTLLSIGPLDEYTTYYWRLKASNEYGTSIWSDTWRFRTGSGTGIGDMDIIAVTYKLKQNYPNPFNPETRIPFVIAKPGIARIDVFDSQGRLVETIVNKHFSVGEHSIIFNGANLASGVYFYRIEANNFIKVRKMVILR